MRVKILLPQAALLVIACAYAILGALVFIFLESGTELDEKEAVLRSIDDKKLHLFENLWQWCHAVENESDFHRKSLHSIYAYISDMLVAFENRITVEEVTRNATKLSWDFRSAVIFTTVTVTTIGYGNLFPDTPLGRIFCIIYAIVGIPLTVLLIGSYSKFLVSSVTAVYKALLAPCGRRLAMIRGPFIRCSSKAKQRLSAAYSDNFDDEESDPVNSEENERSLMAPPYFLILALLLYTLVVATVFTCWEDWSFAESCYYSIITFLTIGFGDMVANEQQSFLFLLVCSFIGVMMSTMCIDSIRMHYISKIHYLGRKLREVEYKFNGKRLNQKDVKQLIENVTILQEKCGLNLPKEEAKSMLKNWEILSSVEHSLDFIDIEDTSNFSDFYFARL
ncbi:unnamed protein product [Soboliphyme baturini]|uniref:Ion_trans_2 domain-containing protein n=1 Tax=Soboliphyme baturini TaxID=241478 RepID=A0A183ITQ1_9BILA|nr:unnamed protein product [Soboliphyme baturini]